MFFIVWYCVCHQHSRWISCFAAKSYLLKEESRGWRQLVHNHVKLYSFIFRKYCNCSTEVFLSFYLFIVCPCFIKNLQRAIFREKYKYRCVDWMLTYHLKILYDSVKTSRPHSWTNLYYSTEKKVVSHWEQWLR